MIRRPPRSTLFSLHDALPISSHQPCRRGCIAVLRPRKSCRSRRSSSSSCRRRGSRIRSEEHTSELQSQSNLVCRLLLEKKKKNQHQYPSTLHSHTRIVTPYMY